MRIHFFTAPFYFDIHSTPLVWFYAPQHFHGSFCLYRTR